MWRFLQKAKWKHLRNARQFKSEANANSDFKRRTDIYCQGLLLKTVQGARIFKDSTTFVDMKMRMPPAHLLFNFSQFMKENNMEPTKARIKRFVLKHFDIVDSEYDQWCPEDFVEEPQFIQTIEDEDLKNWAYEVVHCWPMMGKKMKKEVKIDEEKYSIIFVENGVIVPGGRFRSFYYWDSYWIIEGLLISEMFNTAKGMIENFTQVIRRFGYIPNGGRIYYLSRSQPPFFILMLKLYYDYTNDVKFIKENYEAAVKELEHWLTHHLVVINKGEKTYVLATYNDSSKGPRPESYYEDETMADVFHTNEEKEEFYTEVKAAAESGWDFSSRWFIKNGTNRGSMINIKTRSIVPVDLNAVLYYNMKTMSFFSELIGDNERRKEYKHLAHDFLDGIKEVLWHDDIGTWLDYDLLNKKRRNYFYPSNGAPLWSKAFDESKTDYYVNKFIKYFKKEGALRSGGVPTSFMDTGQQWDYPNAWSPLQYMLAVGLSECDNTDAKDLAFKIAQRWIRNNFQAYETYGVMFEKYNAYGGVGGGGEYGIQVGFGWTNGVCLYFLKKYGTELHLTDFTKPIITYNSNNHYLNFGHIDVND